MIVVCADFSLLSVFSTVSIINKLSVVVQSPLMWISHHTMSSRERNMTVKSAKIWLLKSNTPKIIELSGDTAVSPSPFLIYSVFCIPWFYSFSTPRFWRLLQFPQLTTALSCGTSHRDRLHNGKLRLVFICILLSVYKKGKFKTSTTKSEILRTTLFP